ncbi:MAG: DUF4416 family protein [bacterium]
MRPQIPWKVKLFCGLLWKKPAVFDLTLKLLGNKYGEQDCISQVYRFDVTNYYESELGEQINRSFVSFNRLINPQDLPGIKLETNGIEEEYTVNGKREINIDPGYMDYDKMVLASAKQGPYKLYLDQGIWGDLTLHYEKGKFIALPWAFADFKDGRYEKYFLGVRQRYKSGLKDSCRKQT